jgi:uncharacterized protein (TIGR02757 family)
MRAARLTRREKRLKKSLDALLALYGPGDMGSDPVSFLHRYRDPLDIEVAGFIAASLAYGRVALIEQSVNRVLGVMKDHPSRFVMNFRPARQERLFDGFVHRFTRGKDLVALTVLLREMLSQGGSIENFMCGNGSGRGGGVGEILSGFSRRALALDVGEVYPGGAIPRDAGVRYFFPSPSDGSACKRLNLFLRWMVRGPDGVDHGIWKSITPGDLVVPLDVHMGRVARFLGLTRRRANSWKSALEITESLRRLDPEDPVKYDYAITRLGILGVCGGGRKKRACPECPLDSHCICRQAAV